MTFKIVKVGKKEYFIEPGISPILRYKRREYRRLKRQPKVRRGKTPVIRTILRPRKATGRRPKRIYQRRRMTGLEIENLKKIADRYELPRDLFDWQAHIDRSLTYRENRSILEGKIRRLRPATTPGLSRTYAGDVQIRVSDLEYRIASGMNGQARKELRVLKKR